MPLAAALTASRAFLALFLLGLCLDLSMADTFSGANEFFWGFNDTTITTTVTQCKQLTAFITANTSSGVGPLGTPPYYMIAFKPNGIPTTEFIGTDPFNLNWQVNQPSGSVLILTVADVNGFAGGIPGNTFTVTDGDSSCLPSTPSTDLKVTPNVSASDLLQTCQPTGLEVTGGSKPYTVSIAGLNSAVVTNVTMGPNDDLLTYINRASPGTQLVVSVSDANGWGTSTTLFTTAGTTDITCNNIATTSSNSGGSGSSSSQAPGATSTQSGSSGSHTTIIAGAAAAAGIAIALISVVLFMWYRRRQRRRRFNRREQPDFVLDTWAAPTPYMSSATPGTGTGMSAGPRSAWDASTTNVTDSVYVPDYGFKSMKDVSESGELSAPLLSADAPFGASSVRNSTLVPESESSGSRFIQHQDANDVVELPPPYIDRGSSSRSQLRLVGGTDARASIAEESNVAGPSAGTATSSSRNEKSMMDSSNEKSLL